MAAPAPLPTRESVTTIRPDGSRPFLFPADTHGRFTLARRVSAFLLIAFYLSLPWIPIGGYPAVFLDVAERRFHLFGLTLAAQDMWLLFFVITGLGFSLFFITALLGRIWCGWACPHTVFLDHVYRRIERLIDGDAVQRRQLDEAPLSGGKLLRRVAKHALFILVSGTIAHLFLAYFVSLPEVWAMMSAAPVEHWSAFAFMMIFTGILYFNFGWFREQLCIVICPYGRLQSALIDDHSMVIGYDTRRGEPRGKAGTPGSGDCIGCNRCVHVCPTGIDIRQGLQMECVGCTACIDACDDVMTRLHRPRGLIRYDSQNKFAGRATRWLRPRTALYGVLLLVGASVATWALSTVKPANFGVTRIVGSPYVVSDQTIRNQFLVRLVNKRNHPVRFVVSVSDARPGLTQAGFREPVEVPALGEIVQPLVLQQRRSDYNGSFFFDVKVQDEAGTFHLKRQVDFQGPDVRLLHEEDEEKEKRQGH
ncbi:MAG TPA: cytochrome c oxidase accessory protein CcoG [Opitutaceae bacterium]|nr:cytochrome c oxidase accessory protein CcoG [Opitutaceae bacterium]HND63068.1 cytochrome c oxidase accessory protein CcoG [Opitutaceae bacterium]